MPNDGSEPTPQSRDSMDDVLALYRRDVDRTLLRANLRLTPTERLQQLARFLAGVTKLRESARRAR